MQTEETFEASRSFARTCDAKPWGAGKTRVVSVHALTNGYPAHDRRAGDVWCHAVDTFTSTEVPTLVINVAGEAWPHRMLDAVYLVERPGSIAPWYVASWHHAEGTGLGSGVLDRVHLCPMVPTSDEHGRYVQLTPSGRFVHVAVSARIPALEGKPF